MIRYRVAFASAVLVAFFASNAMAASSVGKMTASGSVQLNGVQLPVEGVPSWPLVLGDEIATTARPATIMLNDGSRVYVEKNSRVAMKKGLAGKIQVLLVAGSLRYILGGSGAGSPVSIVAQGQQVSGAAMPEGVVSITASGLSIGPEEIRQSNPAPRPPARSRQLAQRSKNCAAIDQPPDPSHKSPCSPECVGPDCVGPPGQEP